ncbi:MAG: archease [Betaproteobacteria bacterium]|nr:MAG: archease [Betaproteobacteria bacterium]
MAPKSPSHVGWQHFDHDADVGVRGVGITRAEAFEQAALALTSIVTQIESVEARQRIEISAENSDPELLFVEWLDALIFEMATRKMLFSRYKVDIQADRLSASVWGEPVDVERHQPAVEIKGATLTELKVEEQDDGQWLAQCVVDV